MTKKDFDSATENQSPTSMYASREKIYPRQVHGLFAFWRSIGVFTLLGLYYLIPWLLWDGHQVILFDLPDRKFYIFGLILWPQDFFLLALILIIAGVSLFFFTAVAGRLWCGFSCPQTVWTEVFLWIERKIEGNRQQQIKLDQQELNTHKIFLKFSKHAVWIIFSLFTGFTFVGYFTPIRELGDAISLQTLGGWETFWILFYSLATYGNAGWLREQVCIYMCPYARFQSAMFDADTLIISYDSVRGDPRGSRNKASDKTTLGLGDCIDCTLCVQVCPTGIDIRDGLQYECITCAACVDVCDSVMDKLDYDQGLIRFTTENQLQGKTNKQNKVRARTLIYSLVLGLLSFVLVYSVATRVPVLLDVVRDRGAIYRETWDGYIENIYTVRILNMDAKTHQYQLTISGMDKLELRMKNKIVTVPAGKVIEVPIWIRGDPNYLTRARYEINFRVKSVDQPSLVATEESRFFAPRPE
ncbi:Type cbb3 cytochrome oxidase biogenesis protein CcoG, involved in Cu oxidation [hydrothermal vent metagenome]|uniref:Type cbb3 cytochrome oxidase biogenesis protein CcoG, involved in Cu oxidation n=1 Tax=hydrothermal vent metagenome TaxID=652676 RepID=A0A3B0Y9W5_9ZZZZ